MVFNSHVMFFLVLGSTLIMSKGYSLIGMIFTILSKAVSALPESLILLGVMVTNFLTDPDMLRLNCFLNGSLEVTLMVFFNILPPNPWVFTLILIVPSPPGGICFV